MRYFDLHCDTATRAYETELSFSDETLQVNKKALASFDEAFQTFAVFFNDERTDSGMEFFFNVKEFLFK